MKEAVWIVGHGLLGSAIESRMRKECLDAEIFVPPFFSWNNPQTLEAEFQKAMGEFGAIAKRCQTYRIFWTAGRGIMSSTEEDMLCETDNLALFLRILEAETNLKVIPGVLSFASSAGGVYAGSTADTITEDTSVLPTTAYGRGKMAQEELVKKCIKNNRSIFIARISNLYGPGQSRTKKQGLLTHIARCMLTRTPIHIFVPFDTMRDYIHVTDCAGDMVQASGLQPPGTCVIKIIASEDPETIASIIGIFRRITRRAPLLVTGTNSLGAVYPHRMRFSSTVLREARGLKRTSLPEGIAETFAHERLEYARSGMPV